MIWEAEVVEEEKEENLGDFPILPVESENRAEESKIGKALPYFTAFLAITFVGLSIAYVGMEAGKFLASIDWAEVFDTIVKIAAALGIGALILFALLSSILSKNEREGGERESKQCNCCCGQDVEINVRIR